MQNPSFAPSFSISWQLSLQGQTVGANSSFCLFVSIKFFLFQEMGNHRHTRTNRRPDLQIPNKNPHPSTPLQNLLHHLNSSINFVIPHTIPRQIHLEFIEKNVAQLLKKYSELVDQDLNQTQALQFLFDVKFVTTMCVPRENVGLVGESQRICDGFRGKIDPFDLDVFYGYLQGNVKRSVGQSQVSGEKRFVKNRFNFFGILCLWWILHWANREEYFNNSNL